MLVEAGIGVEVASSAAKSLSVSATGIKKGSYGVSDLQVNFDPGCLSYLKSTYGLVHTIYVADNVTVIATSESMQAVVASLEAKLTIAPTDLAVRAALDYAKQVESKSTRSGANLVFAYEFAPLEIDTYDSGEYGKLKVGRARTLYGEWSVELLDVVGQEPRKYTLVDLQPGAPGVFTMPAEVNKPIASNTPGVAHYAFLQIRSTGDASKFEIVNSYFARVRPAN